MLCNSILTHRGKGNTKIFWKFSESSPLHLLFCKVTGLFCYILLLFLIKKAQPDSTAVHAAYCSLSSTDNDLSLQLKGHKCATTLPQETIGQTNTFYMAWFCETLAINGFYILQETLIFSQAL